MQVREAVRKASQYLPEVFDEAQDQQLQLEGVEKSEDGQFWKITFSYSNGMLGLPSLTTGRPEPIIQYKTVKVRDSNGEFLGAQNGFLVGVL